MLTSHDFVVNFKLIFVESGETVRKSPLIEALIFYIVLAFLIVITARMVFDSATNVVVKEYGERQCLFGKQSLEAIGKTLREAYAELNFLSQLPEIKTLDRKTLSKTLWSVYEMESSSVASLTRMGPDGRIIATVPFSELDGTDISYQEHIKRVLSARSPIIGGPLKVVQGFKAMVIHVPVFEKDTLFVGTVAAVFRFEPLVERFIQHLFSDSGDVWISNQFGRLIYHNRMESLGGVAGVFFSSDENVLNFLGNFATVRDKGWFVYDDLVGEKHIFSFATVEIGPDKWTLGIDRPISMVTGTLIDFRRKFFWAMAVVMMLALVAVVSLAVQTEKRAKAENLLKQSIENERKREQIAHIYTASHGMLTSSAQLNVLGEVTKLFYEIFSPPFVLCWEFNDEKTLMHYFVQPSVLGKHNNKFALDQMILGHIFPDALMSEIGDAMWVKIESNRVFAEFPFVGIMVSDWGEYSSIREYCLVCLRTDEKTYGVILSPYLDYPSEVVETFAVAISQTLYANEVLKRLQFSNTVYADTLANVDSIIFLVDRNFNLLSASKAFCDSFNITGDYIGRGVFDLVPILRELHHDFLYEKVIRTCSPVETEEAYISSDGGRKFVRTKIVPVVKEYGVVESVLIVMRDFTESRLLEEKLRSAAEELAQKNRVLHQQSITDELTGLRNRRYFISALPQVLSDSIRRQNPLALFVVDIDKFKQLNDTYGHQVGDNVLSGVGELIRKFLRSGDFAARYGGDEFVMVLMECSVKEAEETAERFRATIERTLFPDHRGDRTIKITVSIGVAVLTEDVSDPDDLLRRADRALYSAKGAGRNRVSIYTD